MRVGGGKKHGRYMIGDGTLDTTTIPTLSQIRVRSTSSSPAIRPRSNTTQSQMETLQAQLAEERRPREEMEQRIVAERQEMEQRMMAERLRVEAEWQAERQRIEHMLQYMQGLGEKVGAPMPPVLFTAPHAPSAVTPNPSAASNDGPQDLDLSPWPCQ